MGLEDKVQVPSLPFVSPRNHDDLEDVRKHHKADIVIWGVSDAVSIDIHHTTFDPSNYIGA